MDLSVKSGKEVKIGPMKSAIAWGKKIVIEQIAAMEKKRFAKEARKVFWYRTASPDEIEIVSSALQKFKDNRKDLETVARSLRILGSRAGKDAIFTAMKCMANFGDPIVIDYLDAVAKNSYMHYEFYALQEKACHRPVLSTSELCTKAIADAIEKLEKANGPGEAIGIAKSYLEEFNKPRECTGSHGNSGRESFYDGANYDGR